MTTEQALKIELEVAKLLHKSPWIEGDRDVIQNPEKEDVWIIFNKHSSDTCVGLMEWLCNHKYGHKLVFIIEGLVYGDINDGLAKTVYACTRKIVIQKMEES